MRTDLAIMVDQSTHIHDRIGGNGSKGLHDSSCQDVDAFAELDIAFANGCGMNNGSETMPFTGEPFKNCAAR